MGAPEGRRLPRAGRIRHSGEIRAIMRRGRRTRTDHVDVFVGASPVARPRVGWVVPKHRHTIVDRNRLRRRIREVARLEVLPRLWAGGEDVDVLVRARREAYDAPYALLRSEIMGVVEAWCSGR